MNTKKARYLSRIHTQAAVVLPVLTLLLALTAEAQTTPTILAPPASLKVALGCDASFIVYAQGTEPLSYQWAFNGTNILDATNQDLTLTNVQTSNFGSYTVIITNVFGSVTSSPPALLGLAHVPVANADTIYRFIEGGVRVNARVLLANDKDVDGNALTVISVSPMSSGGGSVGLTNTYGLNYVYYAPPSTNTTSDTFTYTISDGHCDTANGTVTVLIKPDNPLPENFTIAPANGTSWLTWDTIPGSTYSSVQAASSLSAGFWQTLSGPLTADSFGVVQFYDVLPEQPQRFYRLIVF